MPTFDTSPTFDTIAVCARCSDGIQFDLWDLNLTPDEDIEAVEARLRARLQEHEPLRYETEGDYSFTPWRCELCDELNPGHATYFRKKEHSP